MCLRELKKKRENTRSMITPRQVRLDLMAMASGEASNRPERRITRTFLGWRDNPWLNPATPYPVSQPYGVQALAAAEPSAEWSEVEDRIPRWQVVEMQHQSALRELHASDHSGDATHNHKIVGATPAEHTVGVTPDVGLSGPAWGWCEKHWKFHACYGATEDKHKWQKPIPDWVTTVVRRTEPGWDPISLESSTEEVRPMVVAMQETTRGPPEVRQPERAAQPARPIPDLSGWDIGKGSVC